MARPEQDYDFIFKILLAGPSGAGKTSLLHRYTHDEFNEHYLHTIGIDFAVKRIEIDGSRIKMQVWDAQSGGRCFRGGHFPYSGAYYRGSKGAMLALDITSAEAIKDATASLAILREHAPQSHIILVGTKSDLSAERRAVAYEDAKAFADSNGLEYIEVSSKTSENVELAFTQLATCLSLDDAVSVVDVLSGILEQTRTTAIDVPSQSVPFEKQQKPFHQELLSSCSMM